MKKLLWLIIVLLAVAIIVPMAYILLPIARQPIGDFFGSANTAIVSAFGALNILIKSVPYFEWMYVFIGIFVGIFLTKKGYDMYLGVRRRMVYTTYQDAGFTPQSNVGLGQGMVTTQSQPQSTVVTPPVMKLEEE